jgi:hypothetical protein
MHGKGDSAIRGERRRIEAHVRRAAASEIEALWLEVKAAATKAAKARQKEEA